VADRPGDRLARYVSRSLELLAEESPVHLAAARRELRGQRAAIFVDAEPALAVSLEGRPWVTRGQPGAVEVRVSSENLAFILGGHATLEEAVMSGRLEVRGEIAAVTDLLRALDAWLHGALRTVSLAHLHAAYLRDASGAQHPCH
jgi:hypothetical protein